MHAAHEKRDEERGETKEERARETRQTGQDYPIPDLGEREQSSAVRHSLLVGKKHMLCIFVF